MYKVSGKRAFAHINVTNLWIGSIHCIGKEITNLIFMDFAIILSSQNMFCDLLAQDPRYN